MVFKKKEKKIDLDVVENSSDLVSTEEIKTESIEVSEVKEEVVVSPKDIRVETSTNTRITRSQKDALDQSISVMRNMLRQSNNVLMRRDLKAWTSLLEELSSKSELID